FSTACANAYLQPLIGRYLVKLARELLRAGFHCPLLLMTSGGGITTTETAIRFPVRLVESGPAGGAIFAACIAREHGLDQVVSFDMGGTTAKICLIDKAQPQTARAFEVARIYRFLKGSGLPLRIPVIEMVEIGAGGGSIARVDTLGRIVVGPDSAGSEPGRGMLPGIAAGGFPPNKRGNGHDRCFGFGLCRRCAQLARAHCGDHARLETQPRLVARGFSDYRRLGRFPDYRRSYALASSFPSVKGAEGAPGALP
ncbi:MAG: hypothetical protein E6G75_24705, partial [Alphaproteobacteria bacterium]